MRVTLPLLGLFGCAVDAPVLELPPYLPPVDPMCEVQAAPEQLGCTVDPDWTYEWSFCQTPFTAELHGAPDDRYLVRVEATPWDGQAGPPEVLFDGPWEGTRFEVGGIPAVNDGCVGLRLVVSDGSGACGVCTDALCVPDIVVLPEDLVCPGDAG